MITINYSHSKNNIESYIDDVTDNNETVIVTRKDNKIYS